MKPTHARPSSAKRDERARGTLRQRTALVLAAFAVPAFAASSDFGALPGDAPVESAELSRELAAMPAMPFERPGQTFPGSAFFYLADPMDTGLVAMPTTDPFGSGTDDGHALGELIDAGPAARPFFSAASGASHGRALECLAQAVWYEAASEGEAGQRAVAQVVLNRVAHPAWPNTVCGVVYQGSQRATGCQFTFTCDGSLARRAGGESWRRALRIASEALSGSVYAPIGHATHYHTLWVNPVWAGSLDVIGTIGAHRFYRNRGAGGEKAAFTGGYSGFEPVVTGRIAPPAAVAGPGAASDFAVPFAPAVPAPALPSTPAPPAPEAKEPPQSRIGQVRSEYSQAGQWKKRDKPQADTALSQ